MSGAYTNVGYVVDWGRRTTGRWQGSKEESKYHIHTYIHSMMRLRGKISRKKTRDFLKYKRAKNPWDSLQKS
jgi:hypothetical protein